MKKLEIKKGELSTAYDMPEHWGEVSQAQFVMLMRMIRKHGGDDVTRDMAAMLCGIKMGDLMVLRAMEWYAICGELEWVLRLDEIPGLIVERFAVDGVVMEGYEPDFSNTTWEEFTSADTFALNGNDAGLASVLYRPRREPFDPERDVRVDYTAYGSMNRRDAFAHLDADLLRAVMVNYMALRGRFVGRYPHIFDSGGEGGGDGGGFSWLRVTKTIVGDRIGEWEQYNRLPADVVLSRLNTAIVERNERERNSN